MEVNVQQERVHKIKDCNYYSLRLNEDEKLELNLWVHVERRGLIFTGFLHTVGHSLIL